MALGAPRAKPCSLTTNASSCSSTLEACSGKLARSAFSGPAPVGVDSPPQPTHAEDDIIKATRIRKSAEDFIEPSPGPWNWTRANDTPY